MSKSGQIWGKIADYPLNAQQRFAPLVTSFIILRCKHSPKEYILQKLLAQHVFLILIFQYITQNYILAELARMFMLCVVYDKFVCVFLFFVFLRTFFEADTNK